MHPTGPSKDIPGIPATRPSKGIPDIPVIPGIPDIPVVPDIPDIPDLPVILSIPVIHDIPASPGNSTNSTSSSISRESTPLQHSATRMHILQFDWFPQKLHRVPVEQYKLQTLHSSKKGRCCDIGRTRHYSPE